MNQNLKRLLLIILFTSSWSCRSSRPVVGGPDAEEAAIRVEESRQEYEDCRARSDVGQPTCDALHDLYEKDRDEYENQAH
jgi:hypothetical protein